MFSVYLRWVIASAGLCFLTSCASDLNVKEAWGKAATNVWIKVDRAVDGLGFEDKSAYPKASEDANQVLKLRSNMARTKFYIDGKELGTARRLKVLINKAEHTVIAEPEGCEAKKEFIRPPYHASAPLSFTFLLSECKGNTSL